MRRILGLMLALGLLVVGATACGVTSSKVEVGAPTTAATPTTAGGGPATTAGPDSTEPGSTAPDSTEPGSTTPDSTEPPVTDAPPTSGSGGSSKVAAYCKAVTDYVAEVNAAKTDPSKIGSLAADAQKLSALAQDLATGGLTAADAQALSDCTKKATDALAGG